MTSESRRGTALNGVKILELGWVIAGPLSSKYLADNGATVVRIESMKRPEFLRVSEPYKDGKPGVNRSGMNAFYGPNKYSMSLDLRHPQMMGVLRRLIAWADIVVENFTPGKLEEMGLGYEDMKRIKPDIIMMRASIQGQTGPHSGHPGYGILAVGLAGVTGITGWQGRTPSTPVAGYTDVVLPRFGAATMVAALMYRKRTGKGQCIDITQFEITQQFLALAILDYTVNRREAGPQGNLSSYAVPHNAYRCLGDDRWCAISVSTDAEWQALCRVMGKPELSSTPGYGTFAERKQNEPEIDRVVQDWTVNQDAEKVMSLLQEAGVPAGVVQDARDLLQDPQLKRSFYLLDHNEMGPFYHLGQAFTFSGPGGEPHRAAPCLGQDTEYVCTDILGMTGEEFVELLAAGVFE